MKLNLRIQNAEIEMEFAIFHLCMKDQTIKDGLKENRASEVIERWEHILLKDQIKVIGIRPMAPVLNTGPLEGI